MSSGVLESTLKLQIFWGQNIKITHEHEEYNLLIFSVHLQNFPEYLFLIPFYIQNIFSVGYLLMWLISSETQKQTAAWEKMSKL